ncbi:hypothetical protein BGZ80_002372 [Entomortierella chlamydospora]|uniref:Mitochondrial K+-H+ exchange-related-domain-containing protein n=1 Tax=Entomortierella chlamydospora TaxID=101097 RepID=A0A9P6SXD1_9FUNG|nr:hypothetical protein BGZ80_002372 [Entomortierella chlamydospora]
MSRTAKVLHCHSTIPPNSTSYINRATNWAGRKWEELSKAKPDSMKIKLYTAGTTMMEKLDHQETFLKEVPGKRDVTITKMVPFVYPSSLKETQVQTDMKALLEQKIPYHRKYMIYSALWVPVTSLFIIVPLVPNIPLFYNTFRLWSHWKAYNGAKHLDSLMKDGGVVFQPSDVLNLGLDHDPEFAVFFTGSNQLSKRRRPRKKYDQQDPKSPIITESSGEDTPTLLNGVHNGVATGNTEIQKPAHHSTTVRDDDPLSMTDHVVMEGFITDKEVELICETFKQAPSMSREIKRARRQEAEKFIKEKIAAGPTDKDKETSSK